MLISGLPCLHTLAWLLIMKTAKCHPHKWMFKRRCHTRLTLSFFRATTSRRRTGSAPALYFGRCTTVMMMSSPAQAAVCRQMAKDAASFGFNKSLLIVGRLDQCPVLLRQSLRPASVPTAVPSELRDGGWSPTESYGMTWLAVNGQT